MKEIEKHETQEQGHSDLVEEKETKEDQKENEIQWLYEWTYRSR